MWVFGWVGLVLGVGGCSLRGGWLQFERYGMGHKKCPVSCLLKRCFLAVQRKRNIWNTARYIQQ